MASTPGVQLDAKETSYRAEILLHLRLCRGLRVGGGGLPERKEIFGTYNLLLLTLLSPNHIRFHPGLAILG